MDIPIITGASIDIKDIRVDDIKTYRYTPPSIPTAPPITVDIGVPVVDIPGCVEAHETNNAKNNEIKSDDERGLVTYCDAGIPGYNPIQFEPEQMIMTSPAPVPKTQTPETPKVPKTPEIKPPPPKTVKIDCPTKVQKAQEPVGTYVSGFREVVTGYKLIDKTCVQLTEKVPLPQQIVAGLPSGGQVMQVGGVAVIATTSALLAKPLADLLLKAVKPAVKKVVKKVAAIRGKTLPKKSSGERRAEQRQMNRAVRELRSVFPRQKVRKE